MKVLLKFRNEEKAHKRAVERIRAKRHSKAVKQARRHIGEMEAGGLTWNNAMNMAPERRRFV